MLSFQVAQSSPMNLSFMTLNSFHINKILLFKKNKVICFYICAMRVQFKRSSLLPPDHITDLYCYSYPLVQNTGCLYKFFCGIGLLVQQSQQLSQTFTSFRQFILSASKCCYSLGTLIFCMFIYNKKY